jgi:hypothetical protein
VIAHSRMRTANPPRIWANVPFRLGSLAYCKLRRSVSAVSVGYRLANFFLMLMQTSLSEAFGRDDALTAPKSDKSLHHLASSHFFEAPFLPGSGKCAEVKCQRSLRQ